MNRRDFLRTSGSALAAATTFAPRRARAQANDRIIVGVMGIRGRGGFLSQEFAKRPDVEIRYLADPDSRLFEQRAKEVEGICGKRPSCVQDFRRMFEDKDVNAVVIATPDHWHALGTVLACQAGKDVYVEKPTSHSIWESRKMVEAARTYGRVVQVGAQCRSNDYFLKAIEHSRSDRFGDIHFVRVLNSKPRKAIESKPDVPVPEGVDYDMWLGPAPLRPFNENHFHSAWNWFWAYSGGDIINDGVHQIDVARWLIGRKLPKTASASGGKYAYIDVQETPDTLAVNWEFDGLMMVLEETQWTPYLNKTPLDVRDTDGVPNWPFNGTRIEIYGSKQLMCLGRHGDGWQVFDGSGNSILAESATFSPSNTAHVANFIDCIRTRARPHADIEELHYSTILCHYGNIAYRVGRKIHVDAATEGILNDAEANALVRREYRTPWVVPEVA